MQRCCLLLLIPFFVGCNSLPGTNTNVEKLGLDTATDIYAVTEEDEAMNLAIMKAKNTIAEFDKALESHNTAYVSFAVKKRYRTTASGGEHMWIGGIRVENGLYRGTVNNDAEQTTEVKYGDTVTVRKDEITDWMYLDNNVLKGGYTIRAIRNKMTKQERLKMDGELGFEIEE
jgi:uncharacterized protein YegJ (DUF2314 family)